MHRAHHAQSPPCIEPASLTPILPAAYLTSYQLASLPPRCLYGHPYGTKLVQIHSLEVRKQKYLEEKEAARVKRIAISEEKRQKMRTAADHRAADMRDFHEAAETREANRKSAIQKLIHSRRLATSTMADMQKAAQENQLAAQTMKSGKGSEALMLEAEKDAKAMRLAAQLAAEKADRIAQEIKEKAEKERLKAEKGVRESGRRSATMVKEKREKPLSEQIDTIAMMSTLG